MFAIVAPMGEPVAFRWRRADDDGGQPALFADEELVDRHVGIGAYRGLEFLHVERAARHQRGARGVAHAVSPHHQRLPGLQPRLRVLLRPAHPRVPGPRHG